MKDFTLAAFFADALEFAFVGGEPLPHARHFAFQLAQRVVRGHSKTLGFALLVFQALQKAGQLGDIAAERGDTGLFLAYSAFEFAASGAARRAARASSRADLRLRCLPPVTVTLWKHSPECERKNASGFSSARVAAYFGVGNDVAVAAASAGSLPATCRSRRARECSSSAEQRYRA